MNSEPNLDTVIQKSKFKIYLLLLAFLLGSSYQMALSQETVTIGTQVWMLKNLDVVTYRNGDTIPQVTDQAQWPNLTSGAWCYYNNDPQLGAVYGKLYNWYAVNDSRGLAPEGWHIPTRSEWITLSDYLGGQNIASGRMKETGTVHWNDPNTGATNQSGFTALPGGYRGFNASYVDIRNSCSWWSATAYNTFTSWRRGCDFNSAFLNEDYYNKDFGFYVRCLSEINIETSSLSLSNFCAGNQLSVPFTITGTFNSGNTFTAQLSDATGSFTNPVNIGTLSGTSAGTINATIPSNTPAGTGYRIRVISSNPAFTGTDNGTNLTINPLPTPAVTGNSSACEKSINAYTTTNVSGNKYKWFVNNGVIQGGDSSASVNVRWNKGANGIIKVIETTSLACVDTSELAVTLNPLPEPIISPTTSVCAFNTELYSTTAVTGYEFKWSVSGGAIIGSNSTNSVTIKWDSSGTGGVKLIETITATGCKDSVTQNITINPLPAISISAPSQVCEKEYADISVPDNPEHPEYHNKWSANNGTIIGRNDTNFVSVLCNSVGTCTVKLIITNISTGCKDSATKSIIVDPRPKPQILGLSTVCEKNTYFYNSYSSVNTSYQWQVINGTIIGSANDKQLEVVWGSQKKAWLKLIHLNTLAGCTDSIISIITINPLPKVDITSLETVQKGSTQTYSSNTSIIHSEWSVKGGTISGSSNGSSVTVVWGNVGKGFVKLVRTDLSTSCRDSTELLVDINSSSIIITGNKSVCEKSQLIYSTPPPTGRANLWYVREGGTIVGANNGNSITVNWGNPGTGEIILEQTIQSNNLKDTAIMTVTINPLPNSAITGTKSVTANKTEKYSAIADPSILNFWSASNGDIQGNSNLNDVYILWNKVGNAKVKLIKVNSQTGCSDSSAMDVVVAPVNAVDDQPSGSNQVSITPNPAENSISINFLVNTGTSVKFILYDISGRALIKENRSFEGYGEYSLLIDTSELDSGIYYATIWINGVPTTKKVVVVK